MQFDNLFSSLAKPSMVFVLAFLSLSHDVVAQSSAPAKDENFTPGTDISLGLLGQTTFARNPTNYAVFPEWTVVSQQSQSQSPSAGALVTFHGAMKPYLGYNVNFGYSRFTQTDSEGSGYVPGQGTNPPQGIGGSFATGALNTDMYELTLAYAFYGPRSKRFRTIGQIGGGGLFFEPINAPFAHEETRPAFVFGVGGEYDVSRHLSVRAEYRGLFYKMPDFGIDNGFPKQRLFTVTNTPAISLVYRLRSALTDQTPKSDNDQNFTRGADLSVGLLGQMTFARNPTTSVVSAEGTTYTRLNMSESPSIGTLVTFHKGYKPYLGYNVNFGYTRFTQINSVAQEFTPASGAPSGRSDTFSATSMETRMYEMSAAYAFYGPRSNRFRSLGQVGAGELVFHPIHSSLSTELKSCATVVFGMGGEYDVSPHISVRAEYRGLFYRTPTGNYFPSKRLYTVTNVPVISLVYHLRPSPNQTHLANGQWGPY